MFGRFLKPKRAAPAVPEGIVAYAIGDIHGRADLLRLLLQRIVTESTERAAEAGSRSVVIGLGDYIDRGPESREVIDLLVGLSEIKAFESHFLRGNHDQTLLDFLEEPQTGPSWCEFGGREALMSYGVRPPAGRADANVWKDARDALAAAMPPAHLSFFKRLKASLEVGDYFFAHAGARPGVPLNAQAETDLIWIREPFLSDGRAFDKVVVHGHSAGELIHVDHRRINVDTGAYATGQLTAVRLEGTDRSFLFTRREGGGFVVDSARPND
jgi:serine/threonine protein phosphatase 1